MSSISEPFRCGICLDLVYKPIVQACGHVFCFWCVFRAMNFLGTSHCALCRSDYTHFPVICELLHKLLKKLLPEEYQQRSDETKAAEDAAHGYSPNLDGDGESTDATSFSKDDFLCKKCERLLNRPVALNCGHVFCESCIPPCEGRRLNCSGCGLIHKDFPLRVCLELNAFLREKFADEYQQRSQEAKSSDGNERGMPQNDGETSEKRGNPVALPEANGSPEAMPEEDVRVPMIHGSVGCDACGLYPIVGKRFSCLDCPDSMGYDLCEECYGNEKCHSMARFNQHHTKDHIMVEVGHGYLNSLGRILDETDEYNYGY